MPLAPLIAAEEDECSRKRAEKGRSDSAVEPPAKALLPENLEIRRGERGVLGRYVRISLLARLYGIDGVHKKISGGASHSTGEHTLSGV